MSDTSFRIEEGTFPLLIYIPINQNLEAIAKQLYDYWFIQFDFPDENGKPYKSSGGAMVWDKKLKRKIPLLWKAKIIDEIADVYNGATPSTVNELNYGGDIVWITPKDLSDQKQKFVYQGLLAHFTQIYHLYNLLIYNILRRNLQLFITEFCIFSPCIIFISNKNSDKSIEILHISPKYITSVDNLMIHIFSSTFNFLYSFTPSDRLESKS